MSANFCNICPRSKPIESRVAVCNTAVLCPRITPAGYDSTKLSVGLSIRVVKFRYGICIGAGSVIDFFRPAHKTGIVFRSGNGTVPGHHILQIGTTLKITGYTSAGSVSGDSSSSIYVCHNSSIQHIADNAASMTRCTDTGRRIAIVNLT